MQQPRSYGSTPAQQRAVEVMHAWGRITGASRSRAGVRPQTLKALVDAGVFEHEHRSEFDVWIPGPRW